MAKILCVLYDDPTDGQPTTYARDDLPVIDHYPGGQTTPTPAGTDFTPAICWAASRGTRPPLLPGEPRPHPCRHVRQGGRGFGLRP